MPPIIYRPLAIVILDAPDCSADLGPSPLLQKSSSQHDSQITVPSASGLEHDLVLQLDDFLHNRLKYVTVSFLIILVIAQRSCSDEQLTSLVKFPNAEGAATLQISRELGLSSLTQL